MIERVILLTIVFLWGMIRLIRKLMWRSVPWLAAGKLVVITGASAGIGKSLALEYARQGARLVLAARRENELRKVAKLCENLSPLNLDVTIVKCDVSIEEDCKNLMDTAGALHNGRIDAIFLNAGISMGELFEDVKDVSIFRRLMDVNYHGCVYCTYYALPYLKKSEHGKIVVISSLAGKGPLPTRSGYSASKYALHGFFDSLRIELSEKYPIDVTLICPGLVQTDINRTRLGSNPEQLDMNQGMTVSEATQIIALKTLNGVREEVFTLPGKIGQYIRFFIPELYDTIVRRKFAAMQQKKQDGDKKDE
eukprot:CAMPEP_0177653490 /NCGR_PEP_ID=MMETSP0447-20121125/13765_1 /TAXON_ID=0 /ORGANISM="Stygamoeba regulata, Strain BSH-02190019" /LENGTH=307 /DNA_ID=CAMNT_0019156953 /DNA_START=149 /DNA_END=1072 /DNA_ORIENTATION=-